MFLNFDEILFILNWSIEEICFKNNPLCESAVLQDFLNNLETLSMSIHNRSIRQAVGVQFPGALSSVSSRGWRPAEICRRAELRLQIGESPGDREACDPVQHSVISISNERWEEAVIDQTIGYTVLYLDCTRICEGHALE